MTQLEKLVILVGVPAYKTADEFPHAGTYNLKEASALTGYSVIALLKAIKRGEIFAVKHIWRYGVIQRRAYFIAADELMRWVGWRASNRALKSLSRKN